MSIPDLHFPANGGGAPLTYPDIFLFDAIYVFKIKLIVDGLASHLNQLFCQSPDDVNEEFTIILKEEVILRLWDHFEGSFGLIFYILAERKQLLS